MLFFWLQLAKKQWIFSSVFILMWKKKKDIKIVMYTFEDFCIGEAHEA